MLEIMIAFASGFPANAVKRRATTPWAWMRGFPVDCPMNRRTFAMVAGIIFSLVALFHLVRIVQGWPVIIGDWSVPKSVSWVALIVAGCSGVHVGGGISSASPSAASPMVP